MNKNKIGIIFIATLIAVAGVGISYAGFYDEIYVDGYVETATVELSLIDYSVTEVWKVWGDGAPSTELFYWHGMTSDPFWPFTESDVLAITGGEHAQQISYTKSYQTDDDEVYVAFVNIFPCLDFVSDFIFHYEGNIPSKISEPEIIFDPDFPQALIPYVGVECYEYDETTGEIGNLVVWPVQVHWCDYIYVKVTVHIPQNNLLQNLDGSFSFTLKAIQWNDECAPPQGDLDFGDAPDVYPTRLVNDGARHIIGGPWLGDITDSPDSDIDGQPDPNALGDDNDGNDDEDGVIIPQLVQGLTSDITVEVNGGGGILEAWFDFDGDNYLDPRGEMIISQFYEDGIHIIPIGVPSNSHIGQTFARFRISTLGTFDPFGLALDGEVEDYEVIIVPQT